MKTIVVYNTSIAAGVALSSIGAGAQFGWPVGLMVAGVLVLGVSALMLRMIGAR